MSYIKDKGNTIAEEYDRAVKNLEDGMKDECFPGRDLHMTEAFEFILEHMDYYGESPSGMYLTDPEGFKEANENRIYHFDNHEDLKSETSEILEYAKMFRCKDTQKAEKPYEEEKNYDAEYILYHSNIAPICPKGLTKYNEVNSIDEYIHMREENPVKELSFSSNKNFDVEGSFKLDGKKISFSGNKGNLKYSEEIPYEIEKDLNSYIAANVILARGTESQAIVYDFNSSTINFTDLENDIGPDKISAVTANIGNQFNCDVVAEYEPDNVADYNGFNSVYFKNNLYWEKDTEQAAVDNILELMHDDMSYIYELSFNGNKFYGTAGETFSFDFEGKVENGKVEFTKNEKAAESHALSGQVLDTYKALQKTEQLKKQNLDKEIER